MRLLDALSIIQRNGYGVAICKGGRSEHHVQYSIYKGRVYWQAGGTIGGPAVDPFAPKLEEEGYQVFADLYSHTELT
jgi:hypothetical protein